MLTHASNDFSVLHSALQQMPAGFPAVLGVNLQSLENEAQMASLLAGELASCRIIILRVLGRLGSVPGFAQLLGNVCQQGRTLIAISGTGEPDAELAAVSGVAPVLLQQVLSYFQAGGSSNLAQLLHYLADHLLLTGFKRHLVHVLQDARNAIVIPCPWDAARSFMPRHIAAYLLQQGVNPIHPTEVWENLTRAEAEWHGTLADCATREFSDMSIMLIRTLQPMASQIEAPEPICA